MQLPPRLIPSLLIAVSLLCFTACSPQGEPTGNGSTPSQDSDALQPRPVEASRNKASDVLEIPRPNPQSMRSDVAELIKNRWQQLQSTLQGETRDPSALAEAYADFGLVCFGNGLITPAEAAFENATRLAPDDARWIYFLALVQVSTGALNEAARGFKRVLSLRPNDPPTLIRLGRVRFEQAHMEAARLAFQAALEIDPGNAAAHYGLGQIASAAGKDREAVTHFEAALREQPGANRVNYQLGLAWRNLGDTKKAEDYLQRTGSEEPDFPDPLFDEISGGQSHIGGLWTNMNLGSQAYVDGDYAQAVEKFTLATRDHPKDPRTWQSLAMALNKLGRRDRAIEAYRKTLQFDEQIAAVHQSLARLLIRVGKPEEAEKHLLRAIEIDPGMIEAHTTLAQLLRNENRLEDALARYDEALALDPQAGSLIIERAYLLAKIGRHKAALDALARAMQADPLDSRLKFAHALMLADFNRGVEASREIDAILKITEKTATKADAYYTLGHIQLKGGDRQAAISAFEQALKLQPNHRAARLNLARTLVRSRQFERALATYESLINRWPEDDATRLEAAGGAILLGRATLAKRLLEPAAVKEGAAPRLVSSYARLLALAPDRAVRDPARALEFAQRAFEADPAEATAETVAMCLAATGAFDKAFKLQQQLLTTAKKNGQNLRIKRLEKNLQRYRAHSLGSLPLDAS